MKVKVRCSYPSVKRKSRQWLVLYYLFSLSPRVMKTQNETL